MSISLPEISVKRPVATAVFYIVFFVLGLVSIFKLSVDIFPEITLPIVTVTTRYEGASPLDVENKVTKILEMTMGAVPGIKELRSSSMENYSVVQLIFSWGDDLGTVVNPVRSALDYSKRFLPEESDAPAMTTVSMAKLPMIIFVASAKQNFSRLTNLLNEHLVQPIKRVDGVGNVIVVGGQEKQIRVNVDKTRLFAYKISLLQVVQSLAGHNITQPAGNLTIGDQTFFLRVPAEYKNTDEIRKTVIGNYMGRAVFLEDVSEIKETYEETNVVTRKEDLSFASFVVVQKLTSANTVTVAKKIWENLKGVALNLPQDVSISIGLNLSENVERTISSLWGSVVWGCVFVALVSFAFIFNVRLSLILLSSIPASIVIAFLFLYLMGYTLNIMSLSAIAIAVGMVVDSAIVVMENISRRRKLLGEGRRESAIKGTSEVGLAISASIFTTVVVFLALIFTKGLVGILFKQLSMVVTITLLVSLLVSLTLIPMLCSFVEVEKERYMEHPILIRMRKFVDDWVENIISFFQKLLAYSFRHKEKVFGSFLIIFLTSIIISSFVGTEFFPMQDSSFIQVNIKLPESISLEAADEFGKKAIKEILEVTAGDEEGLASQIGPNMLIATMGADTLGGSNQMVYIRLKPKEKRKRSESRIVEDLRKKLSQMAGPVRIDFKTGDPVSQRFGGTMDKPLVVEITGSDLETTDTIAKNIKEIVEKVPGTVDVSISREKGKLEYQFVIDRPKLALLGIPPYYVTETLNIGFSGKTATYYRDQDGEYPIVVRLKPEDRKELKDVLNMTVRTPDGRSFLISDIVNVKMDQGFVSIDRKNQQRIVSVSANVTRRSLGEIASDVENKLKKLRLPPGVGISFAGTVKDQREAFKDIFLTFILGVILVYLVLAAQFESIRDPFIIMFGVPFGYVGVIWGLFLCGMTLNVNSLIGLVMLAGIIVNNAIVFLDYTLQLRQKGYGVREALFEAIKVRMRPVLMTTLTTIFGMLPLALSQGQGSETWKPLAVAVIGGLSLSTVITMILIPLLYDFFEGKLKLKDKNWV